MSCNACIYAKFNGTECFCELNNEPIPMHLISTECVDSTTEVE